MNYCAHSTQKRQPASGSRCCYFLGRGHTKGTLRVQPLCLVQGLRPRNPRASTSVEALKKCRAKRDISRRRSRQSAAGDTAAIANISAFRAKRRISGNLERCCSSLEENRVFCCFLDKCMIKKKVALPIIGSKRKPILPLMRKPILPLTSDDRMRSFPQ